MAQSGQRAKRDENGLLDMTVGKPGRLIVAFTIPMLLGNMLQQVYNLADSMVVGRFVGVDALAAVGTAMPIMFLIISVFFGIANGATIIISQYFGAGDMERVRQTRDTIYIGALVVSIPLSIFGILISEPMLRLIQVPEGPTLTMATEYMRIIFIGFIASFGYNINSGLLQGLGDSKSPVLFLAIAAGLNIVLDIVFVVVFHWDVAGVAWATIIAQSVSFIFGIIHINRKYPEIALRPRRMQFSLSLLKECLRLGIPSSIQQVMFSLGSMLMQALVNSAGTANMAGFNAANKVDMFAFMPIQTFGNAMTTFTGQNVGAAKPERLAEGLRSTMKIALGVSLVMNVLVLVFSHQLLGLFSSDQAVIDAGFAFLIRVMPCYMVFTVFVLYSGVLRGAGEVMVPMYTSIFASLALRALFAYILFFAFGPQNMYFSYGIGWLIGTIVTVTYYYKGGWRVRMMDRIATIQATAGTDAARSEKLPEGNEA